MPVARSDNRPIITIAGSNLSGGGAIACAFLAQALRSRYRVQIIGPVFGSGLWHGLDPNDPDTIAFPGSDFPAFFRTLRKIRGAMIGDFVIAYGLRLSSFGVALAYRAKSGAPCALYLDDDDIVLTMPGRSRPLHRRLLSVNGDLSTRLMYRIRKQADLVFCGSSVLSSRFGGVTVPLGRDPEVYNPERYNRDKTRSECGIKPGELVIGFMGNPRPHVGIEELIASLEILSSPRHSLLVVPPGAINDYSKALFAKTKIPIRLKEHEPAHRVPEFINASDIIVVPQRAERISSVQTPARLVEAMAMGKAIVATPVADIPDLLEGAGVLVRDRSPDDIAQALAWLSEHPEQALALGKQARAKFMKELTFDSMVRRMEPEITRVLSSVDAKGHIPA